MEESMIEEAILKITLARKAITDIHGTKKPKQFISGKISCPICKEGELGYRISDYNGHIHAGCTKDGCVSWME